MGSYSKPYLSVPDQCELLVSRGLAVSDRKKAHEYLSRIGYYRLSAYWYPLRIINKIDGTRSDQFADGSTFELVTQLYVFDKKLRLLSLDALERIEVAVRTDIALLLGKAGPLAHRDGENFDGLFSKKVDRKDKCIKHVSWLSRFDQQVARSKEEFVKHHWKYYRESPVPIWKAVELLEFGSMSRLFQGLKYADRNEIARKYGNLSGDTLASWLRTLNFVRNVCAHHSRLWNRNLDDFPKMPALGDVSEFDHLLELGHEKARFYTSACIMKQFLDVVNPTSSWGQRLLKLTNSFPESDLLTLNSAGFPEHWSSQEMWRAY